MFPCSPQINKGTSIQMQVKNTPKMLIRNWGLEGGEICINVADFFTIL